MIGPSPHEMTRPDDWKSKTHQQRGLAPLLYRSRYIMSVPFEDSKSSITEGDKLFPYLTLLNDAQLKGALMLIAAFARIYIQR